jgi:hypothetical protein
MNLNRRHFFELAAGAGMLPILQGCQSTSGKPDAVSRKSGVTLEKLERAAGTPVLHLDGADSPLVIESIELLRKGRDTFVRVRSKDGAEGVALANGREQYVHPILKKLVIPYFLGEDARDLEEHLWNVYRHRSNYKLQGLALWCSLAWVEFAILDMLGRVTGKSIGQMSGGTLISTSRAGDGTRRRKKRWNISRD